MKTTLKGLLFGALLSACGGSAMDSGGGGAGADAAPGGPTADAAPVLAAEWQELLDSRTTDYGQALRIAALKLTNDLPTLADIKFVTEAADQKAAYEAVIDAYLEDIRFNGAIRDFFRDSFKMGGGALDTAPNFAAQLVVEGRDFRELFTATTGECPTFDRATGAFTPADCGGGAPAKAGILTNPNVMKHYFSNMAFRRVRFVQETFACSKFPAESGTPVDVGGAAQFAGAWPFNSIGSPATGGTVDFLDASAVVCANCHQTMNHQAPLFAHFDGDGNYQGGFAVVTPLDGSPTVTQEDYLTAGETTAWRQGVPTADLAAFGAAMAADPDVAECQVVRLWDWALGKGDVVAAGAEVPSSVIAAQTQMFTTNGYRLKEVVRAIFTSDDFTKF